MAVLDHSFEQAAKNTDRLDYGKKALEPVTCWLRIMGAGRFVQPDVSVIRSIRFRSHAEASWRTMDREASTEGTAAPGSAGAETCGGVMFRGPQSGNGARSSVHYLDSAGLVPLRALYSEMDPLAAGVLADGGVVTFGSVGALHVPPGGATRQITVTVIWQLPEQPGSAAGNLGMASQLQMAYGMSVVDLHTGKWYVKEIGASTEAVVAR